MLFSVCFSLFQTESSELLVGVDFDPYWAICWKLLEVRIFKLVRAPEKLFSSPAE